MVVAIVVLFLGLLLLVSVVHSNARVAQADADFWGAQYRKNEEYIEELMEKHRLVEENRKTADTILFERNAELLGKLSLLDFKFSLFKGLSDFLYTDKNEDFDYFMTTLDEYLKHANLGFEIDYKDDNE